MKITQTLGTLGLVSLLGVVAASAQATSTLPTVIAKGDKAIVERITSLNKATTNLAKYKNLNSTMLTQITASLGTGVTDMNTIKAKLDADTDLATAKADYKSIFSDNRIYAVVLPQQNTMASMDNLLGRTATLQATLNAFQAKASVKAQAGKDVSSVTSILSQASTTLADVNTQAQNALNSVAGLKVDHSDKAIQASNKQITDGLKTIRAAINSDLKSLSKNINDSRLALKAIK